MNPRTLVPLLACLAAPAAGAAMPASASGDCCLGPPVNVVLKHWAPLTATLRPIVRTDEPGHT